MVRSIFILARRLSKRRSRSAVMNRAYREKRGFPIYTALIFRSDTHVHHRLDITVGVHLHDFAAQFRRQIEIVDQIALVGQRDTVVALLVALNVKDDETGIEMVAMRAVLRMTRRPPFRTSRSRPAACRAAGACLRPKRWSRPSSLPSARPLSAPARAAATSFPA